METSANDVVIVRPQGGLTYRRVYLLEISPVGREPWAPDTFCQLPKRDWQARLNGFDLLGIVRF